LREYLDRDLPLHPLLIAQVNRAHAAFAEPAQDLVAAEVTQFRGSASRLGRAVVLGGRGRYGAWRRQGPGGVDLRFIQGAADFLSLKGAKQVLIHQAAQEISGLAFGL